MKRRTIAALVLGAGLAAGAALAGEAQAARSDRACDPRISNQCACLTIQCGYGADFCAFVSAPPRFFYCYQDDDDWGNAT